MTAVKLFPHLLSWGGIVLLLLRAFAGRRRTTATAAGGGFTVGVAAVFLLLMKFPGDFTFSLIRDVAGGSFLLLWGVAVAALYRSTVYGLPVPLGDGVLKSRIFSAGSSFVSGMTAGAISACRLGAGGETVTYLLLVVVAAVIVFAALPIEKLLPSCFIVSMSALMAGVVALFLFSSSSILRLDLFSPLSMKVMKFTHDFVHQFFESMLIPDHLFIRRNLWGYIGLLFSKDVGFWGGLIIWFTPVVLVCLAIYLERQPSVAHIRQGAERRRMLADALRERRLRGVVPGFAFVIFAVAGYQSSFPTVEYWDPKPIAITANPAGDIVIPLKGEVDLKDGKLHKYVYTNGERSARFFVLLNSAGRLTVDLDACAICKPDGYGQAEDAVICYYCKTLIPLETVGKPGGCNPVPVPFTEKDDGVHVDGVTLINTWSTTVQATAGGKGMGK